ncbi:MAG TPA: hypothetical protein VL172_10270 [Kofleriaceae bacterium]|jgi:hypothetical protein|nr:hypothetical protein [Kofleriaceae bacterium]
MHRIETFPELIQDVVTKVEGERRVSVVLASGREYLAYARARSAWLELYDEPPSRVAAPPQTYVAISAIVAIEVEPYAEDE